MSKPDSSDNERASGKRPSARRAGAEPTTLDASAVADGKASKKIGAMPSARRGAAPATNKELSDPKASQAALPQASSARAQRPSAKRATARRVEQDAPDQDLPVSVSVSVAGATPNEAVPVESPASADAELHEIERGIEALLVDVQHVDGDANARKRATDAISQIATRLASERPSEDAQDDTGPTKSWQYLSADYYVRQLAERGLRDRSERVDDFGLDATYEARVRPFLELMCNKYFRTEVDGVQHIPETGRVLLVCNHAGSLPWDGLMLRTALRAHHSAQRELRWLVEDYVFHAPFLGAFVNRIGAVRACQENAERLLSREDMVAVFPEGQKGVAKRYAERYKLQRFGRGGYIKLALRTGTPVVPVAIVGAEETYPLLYKVKAFSKALGMPYLPVTPTFPWLGPLGIAPLPSRWRILVGEPVTELEGFGPESAADEVLVGELNERVRGQVQRLVNEAREARGRTFV